MAVVFLILFTMIAGALIYMVCRGIINYIKSIIGYWLMGRKLRSVSMAVLAILAVCAVIYLAELLVIAGIAVIVFGVCCDKKPIIYYYHY